MISIIVPVYNEEKTIDESLSALVAIQGDREIIIVDGGSQDRTVELAEKYGQVLRGPKGRSRQMNYGASQSQGEILWFVHLDARLDPSSLEEIERTMAEGYVGGGFKLYFYDMGGWLIRYIALTSNLRRSLLKLIFGDQGIFVAREVFQKMDGYKEIDLMEDFDFSLRLHQEGRVKKLRTPIGSSARRFKEGGTLRTFLQMQKIKYLYLRGKSPEDLNKMYRDVR